MSNWVGWSSSHSAGNKKLNNFYYTFQHKNSGTTTRWNFSFFRVLCCVILWHGIDRVKEYSKAKPDTIITSFKNLTICVGGYYPGTCRLPQFTTTYGGAVLCSRKAIPTIPVLPLTTPIRNPNPNVRTWYAERRSESRGSFFMTRTIRPLTLTWSL